jgi:hypothetical protein
MAEKEEIIKEKMAHSGVFGFSDFYKYAHSWLKDEDYGVAEEKYTEKVSGNERDISIEWKVTKQISDYLKTGWKIEFEVEKLTDVEVEIDGKKKKMNKGKVNIEIKAAIFKDPESKWESSPFNRFLRDIYNKYIIPKRLEDVEQRVISDVQEYKDALKSFLELTGKR